MKFKLVCGYEFELNSAPVLGDATDKVLNLLGAAPDGITSFKHTRDLFTAIVEAGCTAEVASEVKRLATFDDTRRLDELLIAVMGGGAAAEEEDKSIPKN